MQRSGPRARRGSRQIHPFRFEPLIELCRFERAFARFDVRFQLLLDRVEQLPDASAFFRRELAHFLADFGKLAFAAQELDAHGLHSFQRRRGSELRESLLMQRFDALLHYSLAPLDSRKSTMACCALVSARSSAVWLLSARVCTSAPPATSARAVSR